MQQIKILVYIECRTGSIHPVSIELIGEAQRLLEQSHAGGEISGVLIGSATKQIEETLKAYALNKLYLYETLDEYHPVFYEEYMIECVQKYMPDIVLIGGTAEGRALAPGVAAAFRTGLTADCTSLSLNEHQELVQTRPAFGGNVMASILTGSRPQFATVRPHVMLPATPEKRAEGKTECIRKKAAVQEDKVRIIRVEEAEGNGDLTAYNLLVAAGRGVKKREDLEMLRQLAALLGGRLVSSRALVEKGWMQPEEQIGLSGNSVCPQYMITCGVSGTVQFMAGMKNTKNIIAINSDPNARIFDIAHYPILGDLYEIVPRLITSLKKGGDVHPETELSGNA